MPDPIKKARSLLGVPYVWGGQSCRGTDCSGLIKQIYPDFPRLSNDQRLRTKPTNNPAPGDLAFLTGTIKNRPKGWATHVGIVTDRGTVIHASASQRRVVEVPLTHFSKNRQFLGFGSLGRSPLPALPSSDFSTIVEKNPASQEDPNMPDLNSLISQLLQPRQQYTPQYNPLQPRQMPNPGYNPGQERVGLVDLNQMFGMNPMPGKPIDNRQTIPGQSPFDEYAGAQRQAQAAQVNPEMEQAIAQAKAKANYHKAIAALMETNPMPQQQVPEYQPYPELNIPQMPERPTPQLDPMSAGLGALAGLVDPGGAGMYASNPFQAAVAAADRTYADRMMKFEQVLRDFQMQHEHDLAARNDRMHYERSKNDALYSNALLSRMNALQPAQEALTGQMEGEQANSLSTLLPRMQNAGKASLEANLIGQKMGLEQQAEGQRLAGHQLAERERSDSLKALLPYARGIYAADTRLQGQREANTTRQQIAKGNNATTLQAAKIRAEVSMKRAEQVQANRQYKDTELDKLYQALNQSKRLLLSAEQKARSAYATGMMKDEGVDESEYVNKWTTSAQKQLDQDRAALETHLQRKQATPGQPAPVKPAKKTGGEPVLRWNPQTGQWTKIK